MNIIDIPTNTRITLAQANRQPRIAGTADTPRKTQITEKTHPDAMADNGLAWEQGTQRPGPDYVPAPPQKDEAGAFLPQQWILRVITPEQIAAHRTNTLQQIDAVVDQWRVARTSPGAFITAEYEIKREDAAAHLSAIITNPAAAVPPTIQAVATRYNITPEHAAKTIIGRATILPEQLRASAAVRDQQKGVCEQAVDIPTIDQALADTTTLLAQIPNPS